MMRWTTKAFEELTPLELYHILQLRSEVFVVEQACPYLDEDGRDPHCAHVMGYDNDRLIAYARLLPPGLAYPEASIGRVVNSPSVRRSGIGKSLVRESIAQVHNIYGAGPIKIGAQLYLRGFYESFGFEKYDEGYLEDNIPHIPMILK